MWTKLRVKPHTMVRKEVFSIWEKEVPRKDLILVSDGSVPLLSKLQEKEWRVGKERLVCCARERCVKLLSVLLKLKESKCVPTYLNFTPHQFFCMYRWLFLSHNQYWSLSTLSRWLGYSGDVVLFESFNLLRWQHCLLSGCSAPRSSGACVFGEGSVCCAFKS